MDTSETYVKMCNCNEIQGVWIPSEGDWCIESQYRDIPLVLLTDLRGWGFITGRNWEEDDAFNKEKSIWLPRQDQLQAMFSEYSHFGLIQKFYSFVFLDPDMEDYLKGNDRIYYVKEYVKQFTSMEQLWLAFVMWERWGKTWSGDTKGWEDKVQQKS